MEKSDRSEAINQASWALVDTEGRWRNWGTITVARAVIKAIEAAGYKIVPDGRDDGNEG